MMHQCPSCGNASFEEVAESGEWWWMCHECDYTEESADGLECCDFDPAALGFEGEDYLEDDEQLDYGWGFDGDLDGDDYSDVEEEDE